MKPDEIGRLLLKASRRNTQHFLEKYRDNFRDIHTSISSFSGVKSDIDVGYDDDSLNLIRFSVFANDLTTFSLKPEETLTLTTFGPDADSAKKAIGESFTITTPAELVSHVRNQDGSVNASPTFIHPNHDGAQKLTNKLAPLILRGRLIPRPSRGLLIPAKNPFGKEKWDLLEVKSDSPFDNWSADTSRVSEKTLPIRAPDSEDSTKELSLFDITFPFLSGIGFYDLAKILDDEEFHLSKARVAMKAAIGEATNGNTSSQEIINEIIRPELDALERRFQLLSKSKILKQGSAAVGAVTLSLVAYSTGGLLPAVASIVGASGLGLLAKDWLSDAEKAAGYADSPYYLLWRLRRLQRDRSS
ncbi:hypothetical protein [Mesorhizobium sp.]|uniref:hypothetical protein n=1 Tax=Mesorhizobium sp. TaxID=1871066 RepID=UPI000FEA9B72|nr:hypothetical protein [Mesorhizobium sp.]RWO61111.1 MAG: hypothetical protein EOS14_07270 [Mesorhizobium sp.]